MCILCYFFLLYNCNYMSDHIDLKNIIKNDIYIDDNITGENDYTINNESNQQDYTVNDSDLSELSDLSWANMVEEELKDSINNKLLVGNYSTKCSNDCEKNNNLKEISELDSFDNYDICTIRSIKYKDTSDLKLLHYQVYMCSCLRRMINEHIDSKSFTNKEEFINILHWLMNTSKYLSDKIGLVIYYNKCNIVKNNISKDTISKDIMSKDIMSKDIIPRSSYKFCNYNYECEFNYNLKKYNGCFAQHYVHNIIYTDISELKKFISINNEFDTKELEEIKKSINTILFVINHMCDELKNSCIYYSNNTIDQNHIDRTVPNKKKKYRRKVERLNSKTGQHHNSQNKNK